jgi:hypothetical protein
VVWIGQGDFMATITFDTLKFAKRLRNAGVPTAEAEAISEAFKEVQAELDLATKQDLQLSLAETKSELIGWVVGAGFLQTALIAALLLKLVK